MTETQMKDAAAALADVGVASEMRVLSAHRTPDEAAEFARGAEARGVRVIIAGAGGAAHLAGAMAAQSTLPVIGVPIGNRSDAGTCSSRKWPELTNNQK